MRRSPLQGRQSPITFQEEELGTVLEAWWLDDGGTRELLEDGETLVQVRGRLVSVC